MDRSFHVVDHETYLKLSSGENRRAEPWRRIGMQGYRAEGKQLPGAGVASAKRPARQAATALCKYISGFMYEDHVCVR